MTLPRTVAEVLKDHVTLQVEGIDRMYLNVYQPRLQTDRGVAAFFRFHRGETFASSALMDPIRKTFIAAVDEGSFSAAGRRLGRAQSVVSQTLAKMEGQLGIQLFDRSSRIPALTESGRALLPDARAVAGNVDAFKARARGLAGGLEAELSVAIDVMLPTPILTRAVAEFSLRFPDIPLRLYVEALGAVLQPVLDGNCAFGIVGTLPDVPARVVRERLMEDLGGHILRFRSIAKAARCVRVHEREVAFVKLGEAAWVFLSRLDQQTFLIHFVHSLQTILRSIGSQ